MTTRKTTTACGLALALAAALGLAACSPAGPEQGSESVPGTSEGSSGSVATTAGGNANGSASTGSPATAGTGSATGGTSGSTDASAGGSAAGGAVTAPTAPGTAVTPGTSTTPTASGSGTDANTGGSTSASGTGQDPAASAGTTPGADGAATSGSGTTASARNGGGTALSTGDRTFVVNAAAASMTEIEAGRMAADKAADASVKAYGQMLAEQHKQSGEALVRFAKLHNVPVPDQLPAARRQLMSRLDKASGGDFDRLFIEQVGIQSHEETIRMFESASRDAQDAELKAWIDRTLPLLREHLTQAQKLPSGGARGSSGAKTG